MTGHRQVLADTGPNRRCSLAALAPSQFSHTTAQDSYPRRSREANITASTVPGEQRALADQVHGLGTWFHNLRLDTEGRVQTAPDHPLGDFPSNFWQFFQHVVPPDLSSKTVLDIGCNGGFYAMEMARRGARRVLAIDHDQTYLAQARFARDHLGYQDRVELRQVDVYDVGKLGEQFDLVLFLGVLYHLRHPLYALEQVAGAVAPGGRLLFQTMERGSWEVAEFARDYPITERRVFLDERFPCMYFIEQKYAGDPTNWWIPNPSATAAMLRSVGMHILDRPCQEVYLCEHAPSALASR